MFGCYKEGNKTLKWHATPVCFETVCHCEGVGFSGCIFVYYLWSVLLWQNKDPGNTVKVEKPNNDVYYWKVAKEPPTVEELLQQTMGDKEAESQQQLSFSAPVCRMASFLNFMIIGR